MDGSPGKMVKGMGAMDLVAGATNIIVAMAHANKEGQSKLLKNCTLPLTGVRCIKKIVSDLGFFIIENEAFHLKERAPGVSIDFVRENTEGKLVVEGQIPEMRF